MKISDLIEQMPSKRRTLKDLATYIKTKSGNSPNYSMFLGAGASVTSGISSGTQLVDEWRKEIYELSSSCTFTDVKTARQYLIDKESSWYDPTNEYSSLFQKKFDLPSQRRRFVEKQVDSKLPSIGYSYLVSLFQSAYLDTVFTTNFDDLINEAFYQFSRERPTLCAHDSSIKGVSVNSSRPKIIKVHGDYLFDSIKSTLNETEFLEINTREKLIEFTKKYGMIFIGYAGNDRSIIDVLNYLLRQDEFLGNGIYWCIRKDDEINPDLHKILKRERVYYVEIDGFDEALAELHYCIIGEGLSLESNFKSTKRESMLANFIEDYYKLSQNSYICQDIDKLKNHTNRLDISNLINELSSENYVNTTGFTEVDFRNLLSLDMLMKNKKFDEAEKEAIKSLSLCSSDDLKNSYLSRLIAIYHQQEKYELALEQAEIIIEMDEFSVKNNLRKLSLLRDSIKKMEFITILLDKFKYSCDIKNQYVLESLNHRSSKNFKNDVNLDNLMKKLELSLNINPSLENMAWELTQKTLEAIKSTTDNGKEYKEELNKIIDKMSQKNPHHINTLEMRMKSCINDADIDKAIILLKELDEIYKISSHKKRESLFELMISINRKLPSFRNRDKAIECSKDLLEKYKYKFDKSESALTHLFKAEYLVTYDRDLKLAKESIIEAMEFDDVYNWAQSCLDILMYDNPDIDSGEKLLEKCKPEIADSSYYLMKSQISVELKDFEEANIFIEKSLSSELNYDDFLINKSYIYLHEDANQKVLNLLTKEISELAPGSAKEALIINRELANKRSSGKVNKIDIQNVVGRDKKGPASVAAHILLDEEIPARRLLEEIINNDFSYYYTFMRWPVIPNKYLDKYSASCFVSDKMTA
ncbi:SIR2 family protein [Pantoea agglomerans]|uniref:SIR2 family protein n=1 Tax=Enterobacter agglomerans TaxID=549 RepID=A0AAN2K7K1_ENTAG|nr:SIR2 family protein [Pantoea agglomerans]CAH6374342.1 SIR2 family protein [Pantoea agglomerans]